jgi:hypothetical protein
MVCAWADDKPSYPPSYSTVPQALDDVAPTGGSAEALLANTKPVAGANNANRSGRNKTGVNSSDSDDGVSPVVNARGGNFGGQGAAGLKTGF